MAAEDEQSQPFLLLKDALYDDPSQLSQALRQRTGNNRLDTRHFQFSASTEQRLSVSPAKAATTPVAPFSTSDHSASSSCNLSNLNSAPNPNHHYAASSRSRVPAAPPAEPTRDFVQPSRRAPDNARYVKPGLLQHHTAPTSTGLVKERDGLYKMNLSFNDALDAPGDTQPDSQIYRNWTSGIHGSHSHSSDLPVPKPQSLFRQADDDADIPSDSIEGVEMASSSQEQQHHHSPAITNPTVPDENERRQRSTVAPTSPLKFETPAMAGRTKDSQGQLESSAMRTVTTPGTILTAAAIFGPEVSASGIGNDMSLTQIFNATQAATSPIVGAPNEDAVFQRPSPTFANPRISSPVPMSSPIKHARSDLPLRSSSEPRTEYHTLKQSQDRRFHARNSVWEETHTGAQDSWDEPSPAEKRLMARKAKEQFDRETSKTLARISAPSMSSPMTNRKKGRTLRSVTKTPRYHASPAPRSHRRNAYDGPYDDDEEPPVNFTDVMAAPGMVNRDETRESSPDVLSQEIPSASPSVKRKADTPTKVQVPNTSSNPHHTVTGRAVKSPPKNKTLVQSKSRNARLQQSKRASPLKSSKGSVITDSQPEADPDPDPDSIPRPKSPVIPSSPSLYPYSIDQTTMVKTTGYSSQYVPSSVPPMPPGLSTPADGEDDEEPEVDDEGRVPSSPPPIDEGDNDSVIYDEHHYEEHQSAGEDEEIVLSGRSVQEGESLPVSTHVSVLDRELEPEHAENSIPESQTMDDDGVVDDRNSTVGTAETPIYEATGPGERVDDNPRIDKQRLEDAVRYSHIEDEDHHSTRVPMRPLQLTRQSTVPESDVMDDTQPSLFAQMDASKNPNDHNTGSINGGMHETNGTEDFDTARENQSTSGSHSALKATPVDHDIENNSQTPHLRKFRDIRERPDTQLSANEDDVDIEIPQLSFGDGNDINKEMEQDSDTERDYSAAHSVPKKRKITYSSKKMTYVSPSKPPAAVHEHAPSSPLKKVQVPLDNPSSTMEREQRGARAAAQARDSIAIASTATLKAARSIKPTNSKPQRKGVLRSVSKDLLRTPPKHRKTRRSARPAPVTDGQSDVEMSDANTPASDMTDELAHETSEAEEVNGQADDEPENIDEDDDQPVNRGEKPTGKVMLPNRVFAPWTASGYHPATCIEQLSDSHFLVRFDDYDGQTRTCAASQIRPMDLEIGDHVRVFKKGMKKDVYVIVGFKDKLDPNAIPDNPQADRLGYQTVVVEQRRSTSVSAAELNKPAPLLEVYYEWIYLQNNDLNKLRDRTFEFTPCSGITSRNNITGTPTSSTSMRKLKVDQQPPTRSGSVSSSRKGSSTLFTNMAFAISISHDSTDRVGIEKLIVDDGGTLVEDNFDELFESESEAESFTASAKPSKSKRKSIVIEKEKLVLRKKYSSLRFVALIVDSHGRRLKYFQALALGIPCLHHRWLQDSRAKSAPQPFGKYLLPAGTSYYLDPSGVILSRTLPEYSLSDETLSFSSILQSRGHLLTNYNVLLVLGKTKKEQDKMKPYQFLLRAMGPNNVGICTELSTATEMLQEESWDWVFVEGSTHGVMDAHSILFQTGKSRGAPSKTTQSKKRKRDSSVDVERAFVKTGVIEGKTVRVATEEFIVQCLIHDEILEG